MSDRGRRRLLLPLPIWLILAAPLMGSSFSGGPSTVRFSREPHLAHSDVVHSRPAGRQRRRHCRMEYEVQGLPSCFRVEFVPGSVKQGGLRTWLTLSLLG